MNGGGNAKTYSLAIAWNWEFDQDFIAGIERECHKRDLSTYRIDPNNLNDTMERLRAGSIAFQAFYDRASDADSLFLPLVQIMLESSIYFINPRSRVLPAIDKATMHLEFITHGLQVPYTIILSPFHERRDITLDGAEMEHLGRPFVIKPANTTGGGTGVVLDAKTAADVLEARQLHKNDKYLLQEFIVPKNLDGKRGWFRVYRAFSEIIPCWWDDQTHRYTELTPEEERRFHLEELRRVMGTIESVCKLDFFSSEIAVTGDEKFIVVDYVNEVCDMRLQSKYENGAPDAVVHRIEALIADEVASRVTQFVYVT
jgi:hypothetical protein